MVGLLFWVVPVCGCVCKQDNSWTIWDVIMKYLKQQAAVQSSDELVNGCTPMHCRRRAGGDSTAVSDVLCWNAGNYNLYLYVLWHCPHRFAVSLRPTLSEIQDFILNTRFYSACRRRSRDRPTKVYDVRDLHQCTTAWMGECRRVKCGRLLHRVSKKQPLDYFA